MSEEKTNNIIRIGEITLSSPDLKMTDLITHVTQILKDKTVKDYLKIIESKKLSDGKTYVG